MKTIDDVIQKLEYIMESDPRTFSNPECEYGWMFHRVNEAIKMLKEIERDSPSTQPERKMGHWKRDNTYHGDDTRGFLEPNWRCSECGGQAIINHWCRYDLTDFCPNCGADMRGAEKDE